MTFQRLHFAHALVLASSLLASFSFASDFHVDADVSSTQLNRYGKGQGTALGVGYKINESFFVDGGYRYVGRVDYNDFPVDVSMWFLSSSMNKKLNANLAVYGKLGIGFAALYVKNTAFSRESLAPFIGLGMRTSISKEMDVNLEIYNLAGIANGVSLGLRYNF